MSQNLYTKDQLRTYQALPLDVKVGMTRLNVTMTTEKKHITNICFVIALTAGREWIWVVIK